jgi:hypothetical protein
VLTKFRLFVNHSQGQNVLGFLEVDRYATYIPSSVIHLSAALQQTISYFLLKHPQLLPQIRIDPCHLIMFMTPTLGQAY